MSVGSFTYQGFAARILFGRGTVHELREELDHVAAERALILTSPRGRALAEELCAEIGGNRATVSDASEPNMPESAYARLKQAVDDAGADCVIALGGGSPIGLGKAWAAEAEKKLISVVTTYSGSEMANNWYVGGGETRRGGSSDGALPVTVIYDPDLTLDLPPAVSAASGMNAMAHATESLYGPDTNPVIQRMSEDAIRRLAENLPKIADDPSDIDARTEVLYAAWVAAAFRATSGLEHILAQRVRSKFWLDHSRCHAIAVPYAIAYNRDAAPDAMRAIEHAMGTKDAGRGLYDLLVRLGLETGFGAVGMPEDGIEAAAETISGMVFPNPRPTPYADIRELVSAAHAGKPPA